MRQITSRELRARRREIADEMETIVDSKDTRQKSRFDELYRESMSLNQQIKTMEGSGAPPREQIGNEPREERETRHREAFAGFLRHGMSGLSDDHRSVLSEFRDMGTSGQGAYPGITSGAGIFVPVGFEDKITEAMKYYGPMLDGGERAPTILDTATGQPLPFPTDNDTTNVGELIGEGQQVTMQDVNIGMITFGAYKFSSRMVKVSMELLQDSAFDIESYLARKLGQRLGRILNTKFTIGAGTTEPFGIVTQATLGGTAVGASTNDGVSGANTLGSDDLTTLEHSVDPLYRKNAAYMFHDSTLAALKKIKDKYGRMIFMPSLAAGAPGTINGYPYFINNDMATLQTQTSSPQVTNKTILFGDFSLYQIRRVKQFSVLRLTERFADFGQIAFIAFARYDANLLDAGTHPVRFLQNVY